MTRLVWVAVARVCVVATPPPQTDPRANLNPVVDPAIDALWSAYDSGAAMDHVRFISQYWRLAGNPGFNATIDRVRERLASEGLTPALPSYLNADPPGAPATPRGQWDILQWSSVPYDEARKGFGFKASPRAAATLRRTLAAGGEADPVSVRVTITSSFSSGSVRTLVAEIPGRIAPNERIVLAAHNQEPGANDNASGVSTLADVAASMGAAIRQKKIAAPDRTLTFLFLNEISGSRRWLQDHPEAAKQVRYVFSLDMTGEDVAKTGGSFLIEHYPDPGAVWERPWDPPSE